jgi:hypothetical protein
LARQPQNDEPRFAVLIPLQAFRYGFDGNSSHLPRINWCSVYLCMIAARMTQRLNRFLSVIAGFAAAITTLSAVSGAETSIQESAWHLFRTANPQGGADAVAVMHTADATKSDIGLAGVMLRCSEHDLDVVVVTTMAFPPRAQPHVRLRAGEIETEFTATVVPPLSALLLPKEAAVLANEVWQSSPELLIEVEDQQMLIKGAIVLAGLRSAVATLRTNCPLQ